MPPHEQLHSSAQQLHKEESQKPGEDPQKSGEDLESSGSEKGGKEETMSEKERESKFSDLQRKQDPNDLILLGKPKHWFSGLIHLPFAPLQEDTLIEIGSSDSEPQREASEKWEVPTLLNDQRQYTPTFWTREGRMSSSAYERQFAVKGEKMGREVERDEIRVRKPGHKSMMCGLCRRQYKDYFAHCRSKGHKKRCKRDPFAQDIASLEITLNTGLLRKKQKVPKSTAIPRPSVAHSPSSDNSDSDSVKSGSSSENESWSEGEKRE